MDENGWESTAVQTSVDHVTVQRINKETGENPVVSMVLRQGQKDMVTAADPAGLRQSTTEKIQGVESRR